MTRRKFICETSPTELEVSIENFYNDKFIQLKSFCPATEISLEIKLSVKDAEQLIDEINLSIIKLEGGING